MYCVTRSLCADCYEGKLRKEKGVGGATGLEAKVCHEGHRYAKAHCRRMERHQRWRDPNWRRGSGLRSMVEGAERCQVAIGMVQVLGGGAFLAMLGRSGTERSGAGHAGRGAPGYLMLEQITMPLDEHVST